MVDIPIYAIKSDLSKFKIKGVFCSYACGFSFANGFKNITKTNVFKQLIKDYFKLSHGRVLNFKNVTIDKADYFKFGGLLTHDQFRLHIKQQDAVLM